MDRRTFVLGIAGSTSLAAILAACGGGGDDDGSSTPSSESFSVTNSDQSGHQHDFELPCVDLVTAEARTYVAVGTDHSHTVALSADQLTRIGTGETITLTFTDGHEHTFVIAVPDGTC